MNVRRGWVGLLAFAVLGAAVIGTLVQPAPNVDDRPLTPRNRSTPSTPIDLGAARLADGTRRAAVTLHTGEAGRLDRHLEVRLFMVTWGTRPALVSGELRTAAGCSYRTPPGAVLTNNAYLRFQRAGTCAAAPAGAGPGRVDLELVFRGTGRVGVLADVLPRAETPPGSLRFAAEPASAARVPVVRGRVIDARIRPAWRRIELLAYVWGNPGAVTWIWLLVAGGLGLFAAGAVGWSRAGSGADGRWGTVAKPGIWVGALATGLALLYAGLVPPLQAPDEPDHVLSFAQAVGRPDLEASLAGLARAGHFDRIHFDGAERFLPADVGQPLALAWDSSVFGLDVSSRSLTTAAWWRFVHAVAPAQRAGPTILVLRVANALMFGLALALAAAIVQLASAGVERGRNVAALGLLLVPTLPFFAMHVSEFSVLTSAYVVAAAAAAGLFLDGPNARWLGLPLGVTFSLILLSGRSGLPYVAVLAAVIGARALLGARDGDSTADGRRGAAVFWGGLAAGFLLVPLLSTPAFREGLWPGDAGRRIPSWFRQLADAGRQHSSLIVLAAGAGYLCDRLLAVVRGRLTVPRWTLLNRATRVVVSGAAVTVVATLAASLIVKFPQLVDLDWAHPGPREYVADVFRSMITSPRLWDHDFLLGTSFWAGFGWVDTIPPEWFITAVVAAHSVAGVGLLLHLARDERWRRLAWLVLLGAGWTAALAAYALSSYFLHRNLHGRYLLGFYVSLLCVIWCAPSLPGFRERARAALGRLPVPLEPALVLIIAGLHAYALRFILVRYF